MMALYSELPDHDCAPRMRRASVESTQSSRLSLGLDDLQNLRAVDMAQSTSGFSLPAWEEVSRENESTFFGMMSALELGDDDDDDDDDYFLNKHKNNDSASRESQSPIAQYKAKVAADKLVRKVRFSPAPTIIDIEKVDREDYPSLYYCVHELQRMQDEYQSEEKAMRHTVR